MNPGIGEGKPAQSRASKWREKATRVLGLLRSKLSPSMRIVLSGDDLASCQSVRAICADLSSIWGGEKVVVIKRLSVMPCDMALSMLRIEFQRARSGGSRGHTIQLAKGCTPSELAFALKVAGGVKWSVRVPARLAVFQLQVDGKMALHSAEDFVLKGGCLPPEVEVFGPAGPDWMAETA